MPVFGHQDILYPFLARAAGDQVAMNPPLPLRLRASESSSRVPQIGHITWSSISGSEAQCSALTEGIKERAADQGRSLAQRRAPRAGLAKRTIRPVAEGG
jgi:hypothetical protein